MSCSGWLIEMCDELFSRTVNILPLSDRINEMHSRTLSNLKLTSPDIEFPALHVEVYDGQPWSAANFTSSDLDDSVVWWPHWRSEFCLFVCLFCRVYICCLKLLPGATVRNWCVSLRFEHTSIDARSDRAILLPHFVCYDAARLAWYRDCLLIVLQGSVDTLVRWGGQLSCRAMSIDVRNFGVKNYLNHTTIPQLIANNMSGCFFLKHGVFTL